MNSDTDGKYGFDDLGFARPDIGREARQGLPEIVYGPGKTTQEITGLVRHFLARNSGPVLVTRVESEVAARVLAEVPDGTYDRAGRLLCWRRAGLLDFRVAVVSAGTADGPVAAEAVAVASAIGLEVERIADVGVAGIHRLLAVSDVLHRADTVVCVAGMEGALASVVGGLVGCPVIAVPTSVGYGANLAGVTALLAMLSSCAAGMTVVNIDSGFAAAMAAFRIARAAAPSAAAMTREERRPA
ncbi:nickel pincer cofactor biosynthesis protein LarB [Streptomyces chiangmaiensis]|uniref:Nickel pincer cofactor biosynthesis protein LarB n=1 Tax=Streptomyces chiangmaiensis TaxID=766497 RepID=A0ABU7FL38_9ACTN|nr:nickel pincer cofactor biosynthesis protein LarB [Streptomyces chiangmaiensis]MED7824822.1 nickel pincer cofactor biosynthesis protein LarB [Streptomyces chiangmaiensis]